MMDYVAYGMDYNGDKFYIANSNPIIWTYQRDEAKIYKSIDSLKYDLLEDTSNYNTLCSVVDRRTIDSLYASSLGNINFLVRLL
jgi:hypothetical protein